MARTVEKIALGVFVLILIGFNAFFIFGQQGEDTTKKDNQETKSATLQAQLITEAQARSTALGVARGTVREVEEHMAQGRAYFTVEIEEGQMESEVIIDRKNGDVVRITREAKEGTDEEVSQEELQTITGRLTEEQAKALALEVIREGTVIGFEIEREEGRLIYEVRLRAQGDTVEVEIDARTGEIIEIEWGDD